MKRPDALWIALAVLCVLIGRPAKAQQDPGVSATLYLLKDATTPQRDASHNTLLLGLRQLDDPSLLPLFRALSTSPYLTMRVHGQLGAAALSPKRRIDLTQLAEVDDPRELVAVLSAAIDDELIDPQGMATLLTWQSLDLPLRQAIALRLLGEGADVDTKPFVVSLDVELNDQLAAARLLQYALAAVVLAESGNALGQPALDKLKALTNESADAVIGQVLDAAMRQRFTTVSPLALAIANDKQRDAALRLLAIQSAMRLSTPGAAKVWQQLYKSEQDSAQRIRLAMIALDSAEHVQPALFDTLADGGQWIAQIGSAGRAIAEKRDNLADAFAPLIATGQPLSVQWVASYCRRAKPEQGPALLELIITHHHKGERNNRGRIVQAAINATTALCEIYPTQANERLTKLLAQTAAAQDADALALRQVILMGIAQARSKDLAPIANAIAPDKHNDFTTDALRLFIRARHSAPLTDKDWLRISDIVQGVGQLDSTMRLQLGWAYLKHKGQANQAITNVLK